MKKKNEPRKNTWWGGLAIGCMLLATSCKMIINGMKANNTGVIIPATCKTGTMTGSESIITGVVFAIAGVAFLAFVLIRQAKLKRQKNG